MSGRRFLPTALRPAWRTNASLALASLFFAQFAFGGETESAPAPTSIVGDKWQYDVASSLVKSASREIKEVSASAIVATVSQNERQRQVVYDGNLNMVENGPTRYNPYEPMFDFPLSVGKRWEKAYSYPHPNQAGVTVNATSNAQVVAMESVSVPAGVFRALRIHRVTRYRLTSGFSGTMNDTVWYSPDVKWIVAREFSDDGNRDYTFSTKLRSYSVAPQGK